MQQTFVKTEQNRIFIYRSDLNILWSALPLVLLLYKVFSYVLFLYEKQGGIGKFVTIVSTGTYRTDPFIWVTLTPVSGIWIRLVGHRLRIVTCMACNFSVLSREIKNMCYPGAMA